MFRAKRCWTRAEKWGLNGSPQCGWAKAMGSDVDRDEGINCEAPGEAGEPFAKCGGGLIKAIASHTTAMVRH